MNWDKIKEGWGHYKKRAVGEGPHLTEMDLTLLDGNRTQWKTTLARLKASSGRCVRSSSSSLGAGNDPRLHFGLGQATVDTLTVVWPSGLKRTFKQVPHNQVWQLRYVNGSDDAAVATD